MHSKAQSFQFTHQTNIHNKNDKKKESKRREEKNGLTWGGAIGAVVVLFVPGGGEGGEKRIRGISNKGKNMRGYQERRHGHRIGTLEETNPHR